MAVQLPAAALNYIAQLGRLNSLYPNGRPYQTVWAGPEIIYPRPILERSTDSSFFKLGLHTEWDKWSAGVVWRPRIGIRFGAFPYKVFLTNERVDGVLGSTGITLSSYIEDITPTKPYLGLYHPGFTAPSGGTKLIQFDINVLTPAGEVATPVSVSLTIYAQDHASYLTNFVWFDPTAATNGVGSFADPCNKLSGTAAANNGNRTLVGIDWAGAGVNGHSFTKLCHAKGTGTFKMTDAMANPPDGLNTRDWFIGYVGPRQFHPIPESDLTYEIENGVSGKINQYFSKDVTLRYLRIKGAVGTTTLSGIEGRFERCAYSDIIFKDISLINSGANGACFRSGSDPSFYAFLSHVTADNVSTNENGVNLSGMLCVFEFRKALIDMMTFQIGAGSGTDKNSYAGRVKHGTEDLELRRLTGLSYAVSPGKTASWGWTTGVGIHLRGVFRYANIQDPNVAYGIFIQTDPAPNDRPSIMTHFCSFKGPLLNSTLPDSNTIANESEFHAYGNIIENANHATNSGWGALDNDWQTAPGKPAKVENSISGAIGTMVDASGIPLNPAHFRNYGHTVIA